MEVVSDQCEVFPLAHEWFVRRTAIVIDDAESDRRAVMINCGPFRSRTAAESFASNWTDLGHLRK